METIESKLLFEREALSTGVYVQSYCTDNGIYTSKEFLKKLINQEQGIRLSGVGGHHQNRVAENAIKHIVRSAQTMMIHAALRWPGFVDKDLWPMSLQHAVHLYNNTPNHTNKISPIEIWTQTKSWLPCLCS